MSSRIRVLITDDHPVVREGLTAMLTAEPDIEVVCAAATGADAVAQCARLRPDVAIIDLILPDMSGDEVIREVTAISSDIQVLVLSSMQGDEDIYRALQSGARGFLFKDMAGKELINAIRELKAGRRFVPPAVAGRLAESFPRSGLSVREVEVLKLVAVGQRNKEVAYSLSISEATVNVHVKHILEKLGASDRTQAVTIALRRGIIRL